MVSQNGLWRDNEADPYSEFDQRKYKHEKSRDYGSKYSVENDLYDREVKFQSQSANKNRIRENRRYGDLHQDIVISHTPKRVGVQFHGIDLYDLGKNVLERVDRLLQRNESLRDIFVQHSADLEPMLTRRGIFFCCCQFFSLLSLFLLRKF